MSTSDNQMFVRRFLAAISGTDKAAPLLDEYVSTDAAALRAEIALYESAFARFELIPDVLIAGDTVVAVRARLCGTHTGSVLGQAPTQHPINIRVSMSYRIVGGKIVGHRFQPDVLSLLQQIGLLPNAGLS